MKIDFIGNQGTNTRLILIFTGWSTGPDLYRHIAMPGWDVAVVHDYSDLNLDTDFLSRYYTIYLFAWSMGVWAAENVLPSERITAAFAINGTPNPVSDTLGIPEAIFRGTAENLTPRNLTKFRRRMVKDASVMGMLFPTLPTEMEAVDLRDQLFFILSAGKGSQKPSFPWTRAYIGENDHIFPPENMRNAWKADPEVTVIETDDSHYMDMEAVIRGVIADTFKVSGRFSKAGATYDAHAFAQRITASRLADMIEKNLTSPVNNLLEIGPGTGSLTNAYSRFLNPANADFVDITTVGPFHVATSEEYFTEDAEVWMDRSWKDYDLITSASAIQWFADLPRFFANCARQLAPGALLAISTFAPGNLFELDSFRPSPLLYHDAGWYRKLLNPLFEILILEEDEIRIEFESFRHLLIHLKHTGVAGSGNDTGHLFGRMKGLRSLTYRPLYIMARRKTATL